MQNVRNLFVAVLLFVGLRSSAQDQSVIQNYINTYKDIAIAEMQRSGVPASIKLAQGIHETMAGTSVLVTKSNNHFGIKCKSNWAGESVSHDDDARGECFRKYGSPADSYLDHSNFLKNNTRYAFLFKLDPLDYSGWAYGLKKAGYATNPRYPQVIIRLIEDYNLQEYTLIALGKAQPKDEVLAKTTEPPTGEVIPLAEVKTSEVRIGAAAAPIAAKKVQDYPSSEFKINETRVVYAKAGTSFLGIAQQYNVSLERLFEFNDLAEAEQLSQDQLVYLQRKRKTGNNEFHTVREGESLYDIAQEEGMRLESLLVFNQLHGNMRPAIGEQLFLKAKAPERPSLAKEDNAQYQSTIAKNDGPSVKEPAEGIQQASSKTIYYTVQPKETIYAISKKYNVRIEDLVEWNHLNGYSLKTGQQLKIYK
jgi:LysM repeat protein